MGLLNDSARRGLQSGSRRILFGLELRIPRNILPLIYLAVVLPTILLLCFLVPPMQSRDEGRHFLRACQIAHGKLLPQVDEASGQIGGNLPVAESEFVREKMSTAFLRQETSFKTVPARLASLGRSPQNQISPTDLRFTAFPNAAIYPPGLYLPQVIGIRLASFFSHKVYLAFYFGRIVNAVIAVTLISIALFLAPSHQYLLLIPVALPGSLYQIASVSSDAAVIALSVLFVALCIRLEHDDGLILRTCLMLSLFLLTLGKPVYLPAALLLLASRHRLGWRRAGLFCLGSIILCVASYLTWSYLVRAALGGPLVDAPGRDPSVQIRSLADPATAIKVFIATLAHQGGHSLLDLVGFLGWFSLPLPNWFYLMALAVGLAIIGCLVLNIAKWKVLRVVLAGVAGSAAFVGVLLACYVLWTPSGAKELVGLQGRYFTPIVIFCLFAAPALCTFSARYQRFIRFVAVSFLALSAFWTARIVRHYYFPESVLLGRNIHQLSLQRPEGCPAVVNSFVTSWFSLLEMGTTEIGAESYQIVLTDSRGSILGQSDPILSGADPSTWRAYTWMPDTPQRLDSWLIRGTTACAFGYVDVRPYSIPDI